MDHAIYYTLTLSLAACALTDRGSTLTFSQTF